MHALSINNLVKVYGNGVTALRGIDLSVEEGDFSRCSARTAPERRLRSAL